MFLEPAPPKVLQTPLHVQQQEQLESVETGGELEEEDSDGYLAASNEETTSSPDTSFRLSGRSSSSSGSDRDSAGEN